MARLLRFLRSSLGLSTNRTVHVNAPDFAVFHGTLCQALFVSDNAELFTEGDRVLVHGRKSVLSRPLKKNDKTDLPFGAVAHNDIIGKSSRDTVQTNTGHGCRVTLPTLEEYVSLTPRKVTPVRLRIAIVSCRAA